jgi:beta-lactamase superfamily II metal-dependent hydrolase
MKLQNIFLFLFISFVIVIASGCINHQSTPNIPDNSSENSSDSSYPVNLTMHVIDIGQGDAILLTRGTHDMLVDAGEIGKGDDVEKYVRSKGVTSFDYVVATHPHSDHIGGMSVILKDFTIRHFIGNGEIHTTKTYTDMLKTINDKNIPFQVVKRGDIINFAPGINITVLNPGKTYLTTDPINQNSIVLRVVDGKTTFLLTGDAGIQAENDMLKDGENLRADVLKVGHHGSRTATSQPFVDAVKPTSSIISVGTNNTYGLPDEEPVARLNAVSHIYRTDYNGTITAETNGNVCVVGGER